MSLVMSVFAVAEPLRHVTQKPSELSSSLAPPCATSKFTKTGLSSSYIACVHGGARVTPEPKMLYLDAPVS